MAYRTPTFFMHLFTRLRGRCQPVEKVGLEMIASTNLVRSAPKSVCSASYSEATWLQPSRVAGRAGQASPLSCDPYPKIEGADHNREGYHRGQEPHDIRAEAHPQSR